MDTSLKGIGRFYDGHFFFYATYPLFITNQSQHINASKKYMKDHISAEKGMNM